MRCPSVAAIWSGSYYSHKITAAAVLSNPSTLYTGGADGSIIWWNISGDDSNMEIRPVALLCGHIGPVGSLDTCSPCPSTLPLKYNVENTGHVRHSSSNSDAVISACSDGVLCVWSRGSGHCRSRRKLPYWTGSPRILRTLPSNPRYVCVGCYLIGTDHLFSYNSSNIDSVEEPKHLETQFQQSSTCSLLIVDSYTLSVSHIVFHGILSLDFIKSIYVVPFSENEATLSFLVADSRARLQVFPIKDNFQEDGITEIISYETYPQHKIITYEDELNEYGQLLYVIVFDNVVAFMCNTCCIFKLLNNAASTGKICFIDGPFFMKERDTQTHLSGGLFLKNDNDQTNMKSQKMFAAWNNAGLTVIYLISYMDGIFAAKPLSVIPPISVPFVERLSVSLVQLGSLLLRLVSAPFFDRASFSLYNSHITIWSCHSDSQTLQEGKLIGEGGIFLGDHVPDSENIENTWTDCKRKDFVHNMVSSSMVIFQKLFFPSAIIHGYYSGVIELIPVKLLHPDTCDENNNSMLNMTRCRFFGHEGAVLCLATHELVGVKNRRNFNKVLISGGVDCTVRLWNLDSGNALSVMHHHISPVRQIILHFSSSHFSGASYPWDDCFLSVGEDGCVALISLETLRVERMFPGHPAYPEKVIWDGVRGYIACYFKCHSANSVDLIDHLYIWDVKTGVQEQVLQGLEAHLTADNFYKNVMVSSTSASILSLGTSTSSLNFPIHEHLKKSEMDIHLNGVRIPNSRNGIVINSSQLLPTSKNSLRGFQTSEGSHHPVEYSCLFPGICCFNFDIGSMVLFFQKCESIGGDTSKLSSVTYSSPNKTVDGSIMEDREWMASLKGLLLRFSLSVLHLWDVDSELDTILASDMNLKRPTNLVITPGLQGDKGAFTLTFPGLNATLELCKSSAEFSAMRSLTMLSLSQCMVELSQTNMPSISALSAFYTRNFAEKILYLKPPLLQILLSFWHDKSEHVRMAARTLFHCVAYRAIPLPLSSENALIHSHFSEFPTEITDNSTSGLKVSSESSSENVNHRDPKSKIGVLESDDSSVVSWLEAYEAHDWISCVGGTSQDAMTSHIIVAAALAIWYPGHVKSCLPKLVVHSLINLVMAMNENFSSTAAELLAEGMDSTWKGVIDSNISRLISDIFFQIECVSSISDKPVLSTVGETLVGVLLPSLAATDMGTFLNVAESQIWSTASDSPVHLVSLVTVLRVVRSSMKSMTHLLDKVVNFVLQTMDPGNSVMRRTCFQSAMTVLKEIVKTFPMVAFNGTMTKLAVADAVCDLRNTRISIYDMQSASKLKLLDASGCGPPGFPNVLSGRSEYAISTAISAISFSPDGEGLVAFSEPGLIIRWWSLGSIWWEKISRSFVPSQCTKLIFVPPWEGLSPHSYRSSIMSSVLESDVDLQRLEEKTDKCGVENVDLSYRLEWEGHRNVILSRQEQKLGTFLLL